MNILHAITRLVAITAAMTALVVVFIGATGRSGASRQTTIKIFPRRSVTAALALASGQKPRFEVVGPDGPEPDTEHVRARLQLYDAHGNALSESREVYLLFGEFRSDDLGRDNLSGTGRIQVRGEITYRLIEAPQQIPADRSRAALELVDSTGEPLLRW